MRSIKDIRCRKCGKNIFEIEKNGRYLERVNKKGEPGIDECRPNCYYENNKTPAVVNAINKFTT